MANKRLGKGLEALITSYSTDGDSRYIDGHLQIKKIIPNHNQPRTEFNDQSMKELIASIKENGILQPLTVRKIENKKYELIAGERRFRAAKNIGLQTVPVYIVSIDAEVEMMEYALVENLQRVNLNPLEEAEAYSILREKHDLSLDDIAKRIGKSRPYISNALRLLKLPSEIKSSIKIGEISAGHARAILGLEKSFQMITLFHRIVREKLSVRQTENLVKKYMNKYSRTIKVEKNNISFELSQIERNLISKLGTKVTIKMDSKNKGKIQVEFDSESDFQRIIKFISN